MIVVDTNVIGYLYLAGEYSEYSERLFVRDPEWAAPLLWRSELRNVLARCLRNRIIELQTAREIMAAACDLLAGREYQVDSGQVLALAEASRCSAYDCEFVSLARDLGLPLLTVDRRILKAFPETARHSKDFLESK